MNRKREKHGVSKKDLRTYRKTIGDVKMQLRKSLSDITKSGREREREGEREGHLFLSLLSGNVNKEIQLKAEWCHRHYYFSVILHLFF